MAWIESHQALQRHRKTIRAANLLKISRPLLIGHLHCLWWWALDNAASDGRLGHVSDAEIAEAAEWPTDRGSQFVSALVESGFLERLPWGELCLDEFFRARFPGKFRSEVRRAWDAMRRRVSPIIFARDGYRCLLCGATKPLHVDHELAIANGGTNDLENLRTLCGPCNWAKGAR